MLKVLGNEALASGKFIVSIDQPIKTEHFILELQGTGGATSFPGLTSANIGRVSLRKRGDLIWDCDFKHLRWWNELRYGRPFFTSGVAANQNVNINILIPCGLGDGNLMDIRKEDNAVFELTIDPDFPTAVSATSWASTPTWTLLASVKEGVSAYDLKILTPQESIPATGNKPITLQYENLSGIYLFNATATDTENMAGGGTTPDFAQANTVTRVKSRLGSLDADATARQWLDQTNHQGEVEANFTAMVEVFRAEGNNLTELLNDVAEVTVQTGSTATVVDFLTFSLKMSPHKLAETSRELAVLFDSRVGMKTANNQNWNVATINRLAGGSPGGQ